MVGYKLEMVWFVQRVLTVAEMNLLKKKGNLNSFLIKGLVLSPESSILKGCFETTNYTKLTQFKTSYILDSNYSYHFVPRDMLQTFHWDINGTLQFTPLKIPYVVKVGDKIIFV
jgi:hypothetical protein